MCRMFARFRDATIWRHWKQEERVSRADGKGCDDGDMLKAAMFLTQTQYNSTWIWGIQSCWLVDIAFSKSSKVLVIWFWWI
jgi:hypothetical protein